MFIYLNNLKFYKKSMRLFRSVTRNVIDKSKNVLALRQVKLLSDTFSDFIAL